MWDDYLANETSSDESYDGEAETSEEEMSSSSEEGDQEDERLETKLEGSRKKKEGGRWWLEQVVIPTMSASEQRVADGQARLAKEAAQQPDSKAGEEGKAGEENKAGEERTAGGDSNAGDETNDGIIGKDCEQNEEDEEGEESEECEESEEGDDVYEVESILARRIANDEKGRPVEQFMVRWVGYTKDDDTWEPRENIIDNALIADFEARRTRELERKRRLAADPKQKPAKSLRSLVRN